MRPLTKFTWFKAILSTLLIPVWFVPFILDITVLEGMTTFRLYSMHDYTQEIGHPYLAYVSIGFLAVSVALSACCLLRREHKGIQMASHIAFGVALVAFLVLAVMAFNA